jgi:hypothetical protein
LRGDPFGEDPFGEDLFFLRGCSGEDSYFQKDVFRDHPFRQESKTDNNTQESKNDVLERILCMIVSKILLLYLRGSEPWKMLVIENIFFN